MYNYSTNISNFSLLLYNLFNSTINISTLYFNSSTTTIGIIELYSNNTVLDPIQMNNISSELINFVNYNFSTYNIINEIYSSRKTDYDLIKNTPI